MTKQIKSNFLTKSDKHNIVFESKLKEIFEKERVEEVFVFYIPKRGDVGIISTMCSHQLKHLSETIGEMAEEHEDDHD